MPALSGIHGEQAVKHTTRLRVLHATAGLLDLDLETLHSDGQDQRILIMTARPAPSRPRGRNCRG
ncbi:hypothetical protein [Catenuloplanes japonicus]|uniref:hypothetical protein n=1 Tax=Catenuloplanes japonicus TaxID=33876 RepID=UPI0005275F99|nr:hypothetical protein [Catenuloplanes japonicus]